MNLHFDNRLIRELPEDKLAVEMDNQPRQVHHAIWSATPPTPVSNPTLLAYSSDVAALVGLTDDDAHSAQFAQVFSGNQPIEGMQPFSTCYGGHQFGHWAGQLGDGRAISLGEVVHNGVRSELQLKGAGPTPYSRRADGRAVLRSSIREFLCSEAMHHLGVPTTRALSLIRTGDDVVRDMFYDGRAEAEPGAIVCRVSPSFIRFGHFELLAQRGDFALLKKLVEFTINRDFPHITGNAHERFNQWFKEICASTARLVNEWLRVGFVHGVMNTDNMSILGLTIDYGPYGWIDNLDFGWTPNTTDAGGKRYAFGKQAGVARWNLQKLAESLVAVAPSQQSLIDGLASFDEVYEQQLHATLAGKLGLLDWTDTDDDLINGLFAWMQALNVDYTEFFRCLADVSEFPFLDTVTPAFYHSELLSNEPHRTNIQDWLNQYAQRIAQQNEPHETRKQRMNAFNPRFALRNYLAQQAIDAATLGDLSVLHELQAALRTPYDDNPAFSHLYARRPDWAINKAGCSMLSCSS